MFSFAVGNDAAAAAVAAVAAPAATAPGLNPPVHRVRHERPGVAVVVVASPLVVVVVGTRMNAFGLFRGFVAQREVGVEAGHAVVGAQFVLVVEPSGAPGAPRGVVVVRGVLFFGGGFFSRR